MPQDKIEEMREEFKREFGLELLPEGEKKTWHEAIANFWLPKITAAYAKGVEDARGCIPEEKTVIYHDSTDISKVLTDGSENFGFNSCRTATLEALEKLGRE